MTIRIQQQLTLLTVALAALLLVAAVPKALSFQNTTASVKSIKPVPPISTLEEHVAVYGAIEGPIRFNQLNETLQ